MKGDRVRITNSSHIHEDANEGHVFVYNARLNNDGRPTYNNDGTIQIECAGGVVHNTTGVIVGHPEKVHRSHLKDHDSPVGLGANDFVQMVPIMLDEYQRMAWFPTDKIHVIQGGTAE